MFFSPLSCICLPHKMIIIKRVPRNDIINIIPVCRNISTSSTRLFICFCTWPFFNSNNLIKQKRFPFIKNFFMLYDRSFFEYGLLAVVITEKLSEFFKQYNRTVSYLSTISSYFILHIKNMSSYTYQ